jgi:hypothetical protein
LLRVNFLLYAPVHQHTECLMFKSLVALAILSAASAPALAENVSADATTATPAPAAKPPMVKKRVCETVDEDPYSRLGNRRICRVIEVPAPTTGGQDGSQVPASSNSERD